MLTYTSQYHYLHQIVYKSRELVVIAGVFLEDRLSALNNNFPQFQTKIWSHLTGTKNGKGVIYENSLESTLFREEET